MKQKEKNINGELISLTFCIKCQRPFSGISCGHDTEIGGVENGGVNMGEILTGVSVVENFVSNVEEQVLVSEIEKFPWRISQSGRKKQVATVIFCRLCNCGYNKQVVFFEQINKQLLDDND